MSSRSFKSQNRGVVVTVKPKNNSNMNKNKNLPKKNNQPKKRRNKRKVKKNGGLNGPINRPSSFGGKDSKIVPFREQFTTVNGTVAYTATKFSLNPGQASSFPWLSKEAAQWEKYRWRKMRFHYTPQVNEFSSNNTGSILLSIDTDASDPAPADLQHALDVRPNSRGQLPAREFTFDVPVKMLNLMTDGFYVRPGNLPGGSDIKTYDCANLFLSTVGNTNTNLCGYITVEYEVEFFIPILESSTTVPTNNSVSFFTSSGTGETALTGVNTQAVLGTTVTNGLNVVNNGGSLVLPSGNYILDVYWQFYCTATDLDEVIGDIKKNGVSIFKTNLEPNAGNYSGVLGDQFYNLSASEFITSNGNDAYTIYFEPVYSGGSVLVDIRVRLLAV